MRSSLQYLVCQAYEYEPATADQAQASFGERGCGCTLDHAFEMSYICKNAWSQQH